MIENQRTVRIFFFLMAGPLEEQDTDIIYFVFFCTIGVPKTPFAKILMKDEAALVYKF